MINGINWVWLPPYAWGGRRCHRRPPQHPADQV